MESLVNLAGVDEDRLPLAFTVIRRTHQYSWRQNTQPERITFHGSSKTLGDSKKA